MDSKFDEQSFVQALIDGEASAWREFQARHGRIIERAIRSVTASFGLVQDDIREIYAVVCIRLLEHDKRKLRTFDARLGHSFNGWLGMLGVQAAYDHLRRRRRQRGSDIDELPELSLSAPGSDPYENCWAAERTRIAKSLVGELGPRDREFVELYLQGQLPDQIATKMGISVSTVYTKKHKISGHLSRIAHKLGLLHDLELAA